MPFVDPAALAERARNLGALNGLRQVRVSLDETVVPAVAILEVRFWNANHVAALASDPAPPHRRFPLTGGHRVPAGPSTGMVQVTAVQSTAEPDALRLIVSPIGDYSTYTLSVSYVGIDPLFASLELKFRPGCFSIDCAPAWTPRDAPEPSPAFDTLARDYDSFRHLLIGAMQQRVPGWQPTSEADLSVTLLDLWSAAADELADYQDRVMNEAYLATARKRVSLSRHARLVDYHIHQGNQASTLIAMRLAVPQATLLAGIEVSTGSPDGGAGTTFVTVEGGAMRAALDAIDLYTWDDARPALARGDTTADLAFGSIAEATAMAAHLGQASARLLIQEELDPRTGGVAGRDPDKRQLLRLVSAERVPDPQHPTAGIVRVAWRADDALGWDFCFVETPVDGGPKLRHITRFYGNLAMATAGALASATFRGPTPSDPLRSGERAAQPTARWGTLCPLPGELPLLYRDTPPDGTTVPVSTLELTVEDPATGIIDTRWREAISLVGSGATDRDFVVETDELLRSTIRFGNGRNGAALPRGAIVRARWRTGLPLEGNLGRDRLVRFDPVAHGELAAVWNPFDASNGRAPEPAEQIRRNAPEAYRARQLRAVTLADYVARAEELPGVQRAAARYLWTGSWRTVRVTIDPAGTETLSPELAAEVAAHLEALRLIGEDLEVRAPVFVPLRVELTVCLRDDAWPDDLRFAIEEELSVGWTRDGRRGLFHPDQWTFGQALHVSEIAGRLVKLPGVAHLAGARISRWNAAAPGDGRHVEVGPSEILQVHNDPDHMERGFIELQLVGGRR
ncbi:MAG: putative baseplate assembly protein [Kofleriaceae bacterium]